jgi:hypothetical protein
VARGRDARGAGTALFIAASSLALLSTEAHANGRFPEAQVIENVPGDGSTLFLRATFGILVSRDAGRRWRWICERALGYEGQWDPPIAVTRDGRLWVGLEAGLAATRDGCDVENVPELDGYTVRDLTTDARGDALWAITSAPGKKGWVWRRLPGGRFERLAGLDDTNLMTIEAAPSRPSRIYVSGQPYSTIRGRIYRSDDGGATLVDATPPRTDAAALAPDAATADTLAAEGPLFIGAIDREDPTRLLVRHLHAAGSAVLLSRDAGRTFRTVLAIESAMYGFAKSGDGRTYFAGSGLPEHGIFRSDDRGDSFEPVAKHGVLCLHAAPGAAADPEALFVCENALTQGAPAIAVSRDRGATVTPLVRFADIEGPVTCASPDARPSPCAGAWAETQALFGAPADGGAADGGPRPRRRRDAGAAEAEPRPAPRRSSCHCTAAGTPDPGDPAAAIAGLAAAVGYVGRRRIRGSNLTQDR